MAVIFGILLFVNVGMPAGWALWMWRARDSNKFAWLIRMLTGLALVSWIVLTGRWDWSCYYLRPVVGLGFVVIGAVTYLRVRSDVLAFPKERKQRVEALTWFAVAALFGFWTVNAARGQFSGEAEFVELSFPLNQGVYYIGHGGAHESINHHRVSEAQRFALDVNRLGTLGLYGRTPLPKKNEDHVIFGDVVHSPCTGKVIKVVDGVEDTGMKGKTKGNPAGNHVVVRCQGVDVFLAHLVRGSIRVAVGDTLQSGQALGHVGNSGNSTAPHLHIHAQTVSDAPDPNQGRGVAMLFNGRFLTRNSLIW